MEGKSIDKEIRNEMNSKNNSSININLQLESDDAVVTSKVI